MLLSRGSIPGTSQWVAEWAHQPPHTLLLCRRRSQRLGETMPFPCLNLSTCALAVGFQFWVSLDICPCIVFGTYATDCQTCFRRFCLGSGWERIFWEIPGIPPGLLYCIIIAMCSVWLEGVGTSVDLEKMRGCISISFICFHLSKRKTFVVRWNFVLM